MQIKTISYQRVVNLGNYESKRLELFAEVQEGEDEEDAIATLMEKVERKVSEYSDLVNESKELQRGIRNLRQELAQLESKKDKLTPPEEADPDNIPDGF
jgi:predicted  nucleic acid-binding Zn-ribbon protein